MTRIYPDLVSPCFTRMHPGNDADLGTCPGHLHSGKNDIGHLGSMPVIHHWIHKIQGYMKLKIIYWNIISQFVVAEPEANHPSPKSPKGPNLLRIPEDLNGVFWCVWVLHVFQKPPTWMVTPVASLRNCAKSSLAKSKGLCPRSKSNWSLGSAQLHQCDWCNVEWTYSQSLWVERSVPQLRTGKGYWRVLGS